MPRGSLALCPRRTFRVLSRGILQQCRRLFPSALCTKGKEQGRRLCRAGLPGGRPVPPSGYKSLHPRSCPRTSGMGMDRKPGSPGPNVDRYGLHLVLAGVPVARKCPQKTGRSFHLPNRPLRTLAVPGNRGVDMGRPASQTSAVKRISSTQPPESPARWVFNRNLKNFSLLEIEFEKDR